MAASSRYKFKKANTFANTLFTVGLWTITTLVLILITGLLLYILFKGLPKITPGFLVGLPSEIEAGGGIGPFLFNSAYVLFISLAISIPVGVGSGVYLAEFAPDNRFTGWIRTCVENLASVPSIVFGLFGYVLFIDVFDIGLTILGAGVTLSLLNLPVITRVTEEAIQAVSPDLREASFALGATEFQTIAKVVIPAALNGIISGISLAACRAFGESALILMAGGTGTSGEMWDFNLLSQGGTLPVHLWYIQSEALVEDAKEIAEKASALLVLITLLITLAIRIPIWIKNRG
ncbi:phosphate ABC transporter permease PtsA [Neobacillus piezotolerans]|uniref:Phosphate transport system permease protein PstA n=1 Tax=Neobacillus piezotolerans TaxID=2259171 RepID=A0A3D8GRZ5_9BACI|nr:phosphate ABC transporter permease PstA [Neobacillus piezotolerans]RDU37031.1 phosphate ABC transporter permease PtsA [Neobacillus piezotolerans]